LPADDEEDQPALPPGRKQRPTRVPSPRTLRKLPAVLQALVDLAEPGTTADLEEYLDGQRKRVNSKLVS